MKHQAKKKTPHVIYTWLRVGALLTLGLYKGSTSHLEAIQVETEVSTETDMKQKTCKTTQYRAGVETAHCRLILIEHCPAGDQKTNI